MLAPSTPPDAPTRAFPTLAPLVRRLRRALLRRRRLIAAASAAVAAAAALQVVAVPAPATVPVTVAARDLPPGSVLAPDDLRVVGFAPGSVPAEVVAAPAGSRLAAGIAAGEPVTAPRLVGPRLTGPPGTVAVPVRLTDAGLAALLGVGDVVDLLATDPAAGTTATVASRVVVLALPRAGNTAGTDAVTGPAGGAPGAAVVLAVPAAEVPAVTDASARLLLGYSWSGPGAGG